MIPQDMHRSNRQQPYSNLSLSTWLQSSAPASNLQDGIANLESRDIFEPQSDGSIVLDLEGSVPSTSQLPGHRVRGEYVSPDPNGRSGSTANSNDPSEDNSNNSSFSVHVSGQNVLLQSPELQAVWTVLKRNIVFLLVLLAKIIFDHGAGALILLGVVAAFVHCNSRLEKEVSKQTKRNLSSVIALHVNLITCLIFILWVCEKDQVLKSVLLLPMTESLLSLPTLMWHVCMTDYLLKFLAIYAKACVVALPFDLAPVSQRGKYFLFIEQCSQLHRAVATVQPWLTFLFGAESGFIGSTMVFCYLGGKCQQIWHRLCDWRKAFSKLLERRAFGTTPSAEQLEASGPQCPICQEDYVTPSCLSCKHIFCQDCLSAWLDSHKTCPMCRAEVADDPIWRDGTTDYLLQLF